MACHSVCGACCIAPEISSPLPNMPKGKPAGVRCVNLGDDLRCTSYDSRPAVCRDFNYANYSCGDSHEQALVLLQNLEANTQI